MNILTVMYKVLISKFEIVIILSTINHSIVNENYKLNNLRNLLFTWKTK